MAINWENDISNFLPCFFVSLVKLTYWYKFHVNATFGSSEVMTIFFYKGFTRNPEIENTAVWVLPNIWRLGELRDTKFGINVSNENLPRWFHKSIFKIFRQMPSSVSLQNKFIDLYFFIISNCNCLWNILLWIFRNLCHFIRNFITIQITSCFYCFLNSSLWGSFKRNCCGLLSMVKKILALFTTQVFSYNFPNIYSKRKNP